MATGLLFLVPTGAIAQEGVRPESVRPESVAVDASIHQAQPIYRLGSHLLLPTAPPHRFPSGNMEASLIDTTSSPITLADSDGSGGSDFGHLSDSLAISLTEPLIQPLPANDSQQLFQQLSPAVSLTSMPGGGVQASTPTEGEQQHGAIAQVSSPTVQTSHETDLESTSLESTSDTLEVEEQVGSDSSVGGEVPSDSLEASLEPDAAVTLDPELGLLRLRPLAGSSAVIDPELGVLRLRALAPPPERRPWMFLQSNIGLFNGDNLLARTDPVADTTLNSGVLLRVVPRLGPRTFLVGTAGGSVFRYAGHGEFDYNSLEFRLGVSHWLTRRAYMGLNWRNQQLFSQNGGDRFLDDHRLQVSIGRTDELAPDLKLATSYQLQSSWSNPVERSRLTNRFNVSLSHQLNPQMTASLSYQLALTDFTQRDRYDSYHQLLTQLQFALSDQTKLSIFGGGRLGDSTHSQLDFDSTLFGLSFILNLPLF